MSTSTCPQIKIRLQKQKTIKIFLPLQAVTMPRDQTVSFAPDNHCQLSMEQNFWDWIKTGSLFMKILTVTRMQREGISSTLSTTRLLAVHILICIMELTPPFVTNVSIFP